MLRIHLLQNGFSLSDPAMEEALYEITPMRQFADLILSAPIPEDTTIMNFRHLLEKHKLAPAILAVINGYLQENGLSLRQGTIVDATIIHAPSSTKNEDGKRDPERRQTKKGNQYFFGMKAHMGADFESGLIHQVHGTAANVADVTSLRLPNCCTARKTRSTPMLITPVSRSAKCTKTVKWFGKSPRDAVVLPS
jgi:IS5 family transposase